MHLAVDIGNSRIKLGVFNNHPRLAARWSLATDPQRTADDYALALAGLAETGGIPLTDLQGIVLSSVVPAVTDTLSRALTRLSRIEPLVATSTSWQELEVRYQPPGSVGPDRVANAAAARHLCGSPVIVVDFGTATNFDVVGPDGAFLGGAIAPGMVVGADALFSQAARLPHVSLEPPLHAVGGSTQESLQSGVVLGHAGLVDGLVERMRREIGPAPALATGGLASIIAPLSSTVTRVEPDLTLRGLDLLYRQTSGAG